MKTGMKGGNLTVVTEAELDRIYEASLSLLMDPGMQSDSDLILDIFEKSDAQVDRETCRICIPRHMVEAAIQSAPGSFVLHGRDDPDMDMLLGSGAGLLWDGGHI